MKLKFSEAIHGVGDNPVRVVITAQNTDSGEHVECNILYEVLSRKYGAGGIAPDKLKRAFNDNRDEILKAVQRKYELDQVERTDSGARLFLKLADFRSA